MISVVIPLYNKYASIARTIQSVLDQTFRQFEIIVVDDGSTDDSATVVESIKDNRIRLIRKGNGGVCSARNRGIEEAKYDYIALLDADDIWDKEYLAEQVRLMKNFPDAVMWGINYAEVDKDMNILWEQPTGLAKGYCGYVDNYFSIKGRVSDLFCSSSVVIKKEIFGEVGLFDTRIRYAEDTDMWWRIIVSNRVVFYDKYMVYYQMDAENRAQKRHRPLQYFLPFYIHKWNDYRKSNPLFYKFVQRWSSQHLRKSYFGNSCEDKINAKKAVRNIDYSVIPFKYKLFFKTPYCIGKWVNYFDTKIRHD